MPVKSREERAKIVITPREIVHAILGEFYVPNRTRVSLPNGDTVSWITQREMDDEKANGLWDKRHSEPESHKKARIRALEKFLDIALGLFKTYNSPVRIHTLTRYAHRVFYGGHHQRALIELEKELESPEDGKSNCYT